MKFCSFVINNEFTQTYTYSNTGIWQSKKARSRRLSVVVLSKNRDAHVKRFMRPTFSAWLNYLCGVFSRHDKNQSRNDVYFQNRKYFDIQKFLRSQKIFPASKIRDFQSKYGFTIVNLDLKMHLLQQDRLMTIHLRRGEY